MIATFFPLYLSAIHLPATSPCWSSRPQTLNTLSPLALSVKSGFVEAGDTCTTPASEYTWEAGIEEPEQKCPATNTAPIPTSLFATATACFGSHASSPISRTTFSPLIPPLALTSFTHISEIGRAHV